MALKPSDEEYESSDTASACEESQSQQGSRTEVIDLAEGSPTSKDEPASQSSILAEDPFSNPRSKLLFDAIDKIRDCGAGQDIDLPQLVIVGKQSAGKSSLLESLTEIPFPVGGRLCTRFATRIISRRTLKGTPELVSVSIEQGDVDPFGDAEDDGQTGNFHPSITSMTPEIFKDIVEQASRAMGISNERVRVQKNFSSKVLKIELSGPNRSHFGILDVPGIFGNTTQAITRQEMEGVTMMVTSYMRKPQNIIICVADALDDIANQNIFTLASEHAENERIVGVFTKCDRAQRPQDIVQIVTDNEGPSGKPLQHGWFVVHNRGPNDDPATFDREASENATFSRAPWIKIPDRRRGTSKLKNFLSNLLCRRIRDGFPEMQRAVEALLRSEMENLHGMGDPRPNMYQQRNYLVSIAQRFQDLANKALTSPGDLPSNDMKLRGKIERSKKIFAENMRTNGHYYDFFNVEENEDKDQIAPVVPAHPRSDSQRSSEFGGDCQTLFDEIRAQIRINQGEELEGMVNPSVLRPLFKKQASKWKQIAEQHLNDVEAITRNAVSAILEEACSEYRVVDYTQGELEIRATDFSYQALGRGKALLEKRWHQEIENHLQTNNPTFKENVKAAQLSRFRAGLRRYKQSHLPLNFMVKLVNAVEDLVNVPKVYEDWAIIDADSVDALFNHMHSHTAKNTEDEIHDILKAYYEIAIEDFISHVNKQIAEPFLHDREGPLLGLCTDYIMGLSEARVEELGGEDGDMIIERKRVVATIYRLEAAKKIANDTMRKTRGLAEQAL